VANIEAKSKNLNDTFDEIKASSLKGSVNDEIFKSFYERTNNASLIIKNKVIIDCNEATLKLLKIKSKKTILDKHPLKFAPTFQPDGLKSSDKYDEMIDLALKKCTLKFKWSITKSNGKNLLLKIKLTTISNKQNNKTLHCVCKTLKKRKKVENKTNLTNDIINRVDSIIIIEDANFNVKYISPNIKGILGYKPKEILNKGWLQLTCPDLKLVQCIKDSINQYFKENGNRAVKILSRKIKTDSGNFKWIEWRISKGKNNSFISVGIDITKQHREAETKEVIYNITKKTQENIKIECFFEYIQQELGRLINTENFYIALSNKNNNTFKIHFITGFDSDLEGQTFPIGKSLTSYVLKTKKTAFLTKDDISNLIKQNKINLVGKPTQIWLGSPLILNDNAIGVVAVQHYTNPNAYNEQDVKLFEFVARQLSLLIDNKIAQDKIKQSDIILNKIESLIFVNDKEGNVSYVSQNVKTILGYEPNEIMGEGWWQLTFKDKKLAIKLKNELINYIYNKGSKPENYNLRKVKTKTGGYKWIEWHVSKGVGESFISVGIDVTQRQIEIQTKQIFHDITKKANESLNLRVLFNFIKSELGKLINTNNFFIALYNETTDMISTPYMVDELDDDDDFPKGKTLTGYVIDTKKSLLADELVFKKLEKENKIERFGPSSACWLGVPLLLKNKAIGAIVLQSYTDVNAYSQKDVDLLELVANNISQIIKQTQDFEKINLLNQALVQSPETIIITSKKGLIEYINPAFTTLSGYIAKEVIGKSPKILKSGEQSTQVYETLWRTILKGKTWDGEFINRKKNGEHFLVSANIAPVKNKDGDITHFIAIEENITDKRKLEHKFFQAFIEAQEIEKQSFGEELHDGISQILAAEAMYIDVLIKINKNGTEDTLKHLTKIRDLNLSAITEARNIAHGLMSKQLKESGLIKAIEHICIDYSSNKNIAFSFTHDDIKEDEMSKPLKSNIFRIIQEVSTNIIRHSLAKKANISLIKLEEKHLVLVIKDDGVGIDFIKMKRENKGAGLKNIQRRVVLLNGVLNIDTGKNKGTCYNIELPLHSVK